MYSKCSPEWLLRTQWCGMHPLVSTTVAADWILACFSSSLCHKFCGIGPGGCKSKLILQAVASLAMLLTRMHLLQICKIIASWYSTYLHLHLETWIKADVVFCFAAYQFPRCTSHRDGRHTNGREATPLRLIDQIKIPNLQTQMWVGDLCNETPHNIQTQGKKCFELWKTVFALLTSFIFTSIIRPKDHMWV